MVASAPLEVRSRAVAAATRLMAAQGFEAMTVQAVADEVGVTKQAVLHHFPSKEHLRTAVLDAILAHWTEALPRLLLAASASADRFDAVFGELHRFFASAPDRALVVLREALDRPVEMKKLLKGPVRPWLTAVAGYIESGKESGTHFAEVDAEAYVVHVLQMVISAAASASVMQSLLEPDGRSRPAGGRPSTRPSSTAAVTGTGASRYEQELARIARASLFVPTPESPPKRARRSR